MPLDNDDIPEAATEEPKIMTPAEDAERAAKRLTEQEADPTRLDRPHPSNPLRWPGELSPAPTQRRERNR